MTVYVGIDPGPKTSGVVVYHTGDRYPLWPGVVTAAKPRMDLDEVRKFLHNLKYGQALTFEVVLERTTAGPPSSAVVETTVVVGRIVELCFQRNLTCHTVTRHEVRRYFGAGAKGADTYIRSEIIRMHPYKAGANITKSQHSPLFGMSTHSWAALAAVLTHIHRGKHNV